MNATPSAVSDGAKEEETPPEEGKWSQKHPAGVSGLWAIGVAVASSIAWWIVAELRTPDGHNLWWEPWQWIGVGLVTTVSMAAGAWKWAKRDRVTSIGEDSSLVALVIAGVVAAVVTAIILVYAQAELITPPGEAVGSISSSELLDIVRSAAFGLGALGAVAVLIVNYRKQKSTEAALVLDRKKHADMLEQAQDDLAHERDKHAKQVELENGKQRASEIAALHDRFAKAVGQLADDRPAIRLGGVYAIAGVATDWRLQHEYFHLQACADLLCAYLRSTPPGIPTARGGVSVSVRSSVDPSLQRDRDVRKAALEALRTLKNPEVRGGFVAQLYRSFMEPVNAAFGNKPPALAVDLGGALLSGLDLRNVRLTGLALPGADLREANLAGADLTGVNLTGARLTAADFAHATLTNVIPNIEALRSYGAINLPESSDPCDDGRIVSGIEEDGDGGVA
ncbi:pentapeptide repeat-containing protein [Rhodococcus jostii]|uniref:Pentapeptide repeat-containing protein n=1 Tax=Rhodococcus jostii TaxID=132919 RepID=A0ABU4CSS8_RHOJO|nr:pentapeptide repeat-containing protein [Rhodococcus jostii]MDV6286639.1 pentapeptide repeat-containing protein [Rhodococcus jostii]